MQALPLDGVPAIKVYLRVHEENPMPIVQHNPPELYPRYRCYTHATEIRGDSRLLIISGLNGYMQDGRTMPESFEDQADLIWKHLQTLLRSAGMTVENIVSLRTYLADPKYDEPNVRMRVKYLGTHAPSSTVICCQLLDPRWKLEVEAMAAT
jgi:2-iminobutanoate/2-iminopropanoate deaminase